MSSFAKAGGKLVVAMATLRAGIALGEAAYTRHKADKEGWDDDKLIAKEAKLKVPQKVTNAAIGVAGFGAMPKITKTVAKICNATYFDGAEKGAETFGKEMLKKTGGVAGFVAVNALTALAIKKGVEDLCNDMGLTAYGEKHGGLEVDLFNGDGCYGLQENDRKEVNSETDKLLEFN